MTTRDALDAVAGCLPAECHLVARTSVKEKGIGCHFTGSPGEFRLFHADHDTFRTALDLQDAPGCDYLLVWRRDPTRAVHVTGIELKGSDPSKGVAQLASTLLAARRARRGAAACDSALLMLRGSVPDLSWRQHERALARQKIMLRRKSVPKGAKSIEINDDLARIERP